MFSGRVPPEIHQIIWDLVIGDIQFYGSGKIEPGKNRDKFTCSNWPAAKRDPYSFSFNMFIVHPSHDIYLSWMTICWLDIERLHFICRLAYVDNGAWSYNSKVFVFSNPYKLTTVSQCSPFLTHTQPIVFVSDAETNRKAHWLYTCSALMISIWSLCFSLFWTRIWLFSSTSQLSAPTARMPSKVSNFHSWWTLTDLNSGRSVPLKWSAQWRVHQISKNSSTLR